MSKKYRKKERKYNGFASNARNSTKGSQNDVLNRQRPVKRYLSDEVITDLVASNEFAKIILNAPIEDVLKNGLNITILNKNGDKDIEKTKLLNNKLDSLDYLEKIREFMFSVRKYGYAVLYLNAFEDVESETAAELKDNYSIKGLSIFDKTEISKIKINTSKLDLKYEEVIELNVRDTEYNGYGKTTNNIIHPSRAIFTRINEHKTEIGESIFTSLFDRMVILDSTEWSIGQLIYRAVFLIYKTDMTTMEDIIKSGGLRTKEEEINTSTIAVIGANDDMQTINSTGGIDPEKFINAVLTILSIHTNIPKQRLSGNMQGTLAGAEEDTKKYIEYLKRYFNRYILPVVNKLIDKILVELRINQEYRVELPNLNEPTELEEIEINLKKIEKDTKKLEYLEKAVNIVATTEIIERKDKIAEIIQKLGEEDFDIKALLKELS